VPRSGREDPPGNPRAVLPIFEAMNVLDLALLLFVALATLGGLATGFVRGAANFVGLVAGFALGSALVPWIAPLLLDWTRSPAAAGLVAFTLVALAAALALDAVGALATRVVHALRLGIVNRPLGVIPAAASAVLVAGVALALLGGFAVLERERAASRFAGWFLQVSEPIVELLPPPWNGAPERLPLPPIPAPDAPAMARSRKNPSTVLLTGIRKTTYNPARRLRGGSVSTPSREVLNGHEEEGF
jgi:uncharacterized membrane protein required for colicin V production